MSLHRPSQGAANLRQSGLQDKARSAWTALAAGRPRSEQVPGRKVRSLLLWACRRELSQAGLRARRQPGHGRGAAAPRPTHRHEAAHRRQHRVLIKRGIVSLGARGPAGTPRRSSLKRCRCRRIRMGVAHAPSRRLSRERRGRVATEQGGGGVRRRGARLWRRANCGLVWGGAKGAIRAHAGESRAGGSATVKPPARVSSRSAESHARPPECKQKILQRLG